MALGRRVRRTVDAVLRRSPAQPLFRWRASRRLVTLAYHGVTDPVAFGWQVEYLRTYLHPVSLGEVIAAIASGQALPRGAVLITFDDGDRTVYENALPVLRGQGVPAVAFLIAGLLGTDTPFWWREVEELVRRGRATGLPPQPADCVRALKRLPDEKRLACIEQLRRSAVGPPITMPQLQRSEVLALEAAGIAIGSHTFTHPCLDRCSNEKLQTELVQAHETLGAILGKAPKAFAYPNGNADERAVPILTELGYEASFLFDHRVGRFPPGDRYRISRVRIDTTIHPDRFRILVSGLHSFVHHAIGRG